jgi:polar amino acid transport system substrate-binding protein
MIIAKGHPDFVRFVNAVLERMRADGTLTSIDQKWLGTVRLGDELRPTPVPPAARYQD